MGSGKVAAILTVSSLLLGACVYGYIEHRDELQAALDERHDAAQWEAGVQTVPLRREKVPVKKNGQIVSHKTSYSGEMTIGRPAQAFRVLFDTGSNHVIVPSSLCTGESCMVHQRYDMSKSNTAQVVKQDSSLAEEGAKTQTTSIYFGTGHITGQLARERVCAGPMCLRMDMVHALEMSTQPFKSFKFDGIVGLGPKMPEFGDQFSLLDMMQASGAPNTQFSFYLTENEDGEESELTFGGVKESRYKGPLQWTPMIMPEHGHWLIRIKSFKVDGVSIGKCEKCNMHTGKNCCRGIVDTGTSHFGIPKIHNEYINEVLTVPAPNQDTLDCAHVEAPKLEIEFFEDFTIEVHPETYMRRLPFPVGETVLTSKGVSLDEVPADQGGRKKDLPKKEHSAKELNESKSIDTPKSESLETPKSESAETPKSESLTKPTSDPDALSLLQTNLTVKSKASAATEEPKASAATEEPMRPMECRPKVMSVDLPAPLGPNLFLLGEPVVHRYYTVFDWGESKIGFAEAINRRNDMRNVRKARDQAKAAHDTDEAVFMQTETKVKRRRAKAVASKPRQEDDLVDDGFSMSFPLRM